MATSKMIACLTQLTLLCSWTSASELIHVFGKLGTQSVPVDFVFDDNVMLVTTHRPSNSPDTFRETNNLHIFSRGIVALRNSQDSECYVQHFNATLSGMKEKVEHAAQQKSDIGQMKVERVRVGGMQSLTSDTVGYLLGPEIAGFCHRHRVYLLGDENVRFLDPREVLQKSRRRRSMVRGDPSTGRLPRRHLGSHNDILTIRVC